MGDTCARDHTGRYLNMEGRAGAYSRHTVRLRLIDGRELCAGCCEPYRPELTQPKRRVIPATEGELRKSSIESLSASKRDPQSSRLVLGVTAGRQTSLIEGQQP
jgi:hypothetical protein